MAAPYHPPVKRSLAIHGHRTSISLEPIFWDQLKRAAQEEGLSLAALVAHIDAERIRADVPPGLAGAIRVWLFARIISSASGGAEPDGSIGAIER
jgi:predicted DNA-binding ribbon-helix-helix protein